MKNLINFGRYCHFSNNVKHGASVAIASPEPPSINEAVEDESDELMAYDSLMNKKATSSTNGTMSIKYSVVLGVKPMSVNAA